MNPAFLIQMVLIFAIFYFLLIRPQAKERKKQEDMLKALKKGDQGLVIIAGDISPIDVTAACLQSPGAAAAPGGGL